MRDGIGLGTAWRRGLPPGVYEARPARAARADVRMDVAAFVGLAERGPIDEAVAVESFDQYLARFGAPGGGRLLGQSVHLFFANGGRRCVVVRAVAPEATAAEWTFPGIRAAGNPLRLSARDPGAWGNRIRGRFRFTLRPAPARRVSATTDAWPYVILEDNATVTGSMIRRVYKQAGVLKEELGRATLVSRDEIAGLPASPEVRAVIRDAAEKRRERIARLDGISAPAAAELATLQEVRLEIELGMPELSERFVDLGLLADHPRYALSVLRGDPEGVPGSRLVQPLDAQPDLAPTPGALLAGAHELIWSADAHLSQPGDDAARCTQRRHFFTGPPGTITPLDRLDRYDERNELEPISMVSVPDLIHPRQDQDVEPSEETTTAPSTTLFETCMASAVIDTAPLRLIYPLLALSYSLRTLTPRPPDTCEDSSPTVDDDLATALGCQQYLAQLCESLSGLGELGGPSWWGRVAMLDLPPGLGAGEILEWRRAVQSGRGCAALYAPYLRCAPAENPLAPLLTTPPSGAACGIVARREASLGVHAAPANEQVLGAVSLHQDGHLPDPGFLHEARVDLVRPTELGLVLLGSRTTSDDVEWTHLSIRRLVHWLERQLAVDARWAVFEPNDRILWSRLSRGVEQRLHGLHAAGALAGATPRESYFVRCRGVPDAGRVIVEVGVAPSVPAEFIVFELLQLVDGTHQLEERDG